MQNKLESLNGDIIAYGIKLRLVERTDAAFILKLRGDEQLSKHLSKTSSLLSDQENWIDNYKLREKLGEEYYFITTDFSGEPFGLTRLSELNGESFELGSWLFSRDSPSGMAIKADIITREIGFDYLRFDSCKFNVRRNNRSVLNYHLRYNPEVVEETDQDIFFKLYKDNFNLAKGKFLKIL